MELDVRDSVRIRKFTLESRRSSPRKTQLRAIDPQAPFAESAPRPEKIRLESWKLGPDHCTPVCLEAKIRFSGIDFELCPEEFQHLPIGQIKEQVRFAAPDCLHNQNGRYPGGKAERCRGVTGGGRRILFELGGDCCGKMKTGLLHGDLLDGPATLQEGGKS